MPSTGVGGGGGVTGGGGIDILFQPPLEFIAAQHGLFRRELQDYAGLWSRLGAAMAEIESEQFDTAGHGEWPPLAESTLREKARLGYPPDPLVRTGDLRSSLVDPARAVDVGVAHMAYGTEVPYARHHQDPKVPGRPPKRQVIADPLRVEDRQKLEAAMVGWINHAAAFAYGDTIAA